MAILKALLALWVMGWALGGSLRAEAAPAKNAGTSAAANKAYQEAVRQVKALQKDPARRKLRHHWQNAARQLQAVAQQYPQSEQAPLALFSAGTLLEDLSRLSFVKADADASAASYQTLLQLHPKHRLADDAALALGKYYVEQKDDPDRARKVLQQAVKQTPKGDRLEDVRSLLAHLPPAKTLKADKGEKRAKVEPRSPEKGSPQDALRAAFERATESAPATKAPEVPDTPVVAAAPVKVPGVSPASAPSPAHTELEVISDDASSPDAIVMKAPFESELDRRQIRRIVIDAGHGGHDAGAIGKGGTREKDVALAVSKRVARLLTDAGFTVLLTRDSDRFLKLEERAALANSLKGDLFLSIHCNAAKNRSLRGVETYTLNTASDRYSQRLAARENSASEDRMDDLQFILADLNTKANTGASTLLAQKVQRAIVHQVGSQYAGVKDLGTKEALFFVLLGVRMPAILVETSFLSHPEDERRLSSAQYQQALASAISDGVRSFVGDPDRVAKND